MVTKISLVLLSLVLLIGCDKIKSPTKPTEPPAEPPPLPPPTVRILTVVSAENDQAVAQAQVSLDGVTQVTDHFGRVEFTDPRLNAPLDIEAAGFLKRETFYDRDVFDLWPSGNGFEEFTRAVVYSDKTGNGLSFMVRPASPEVYMYLAPELNTDQIMTIQNRAADLLSQATGGQIRFTVTTDQPPASEITIGLILNPNQIPEAQATLYFGTELRVTGGRIWYKSEKIAATLQIVLHENGHTFGLSHSNEPGIMGLNTHSFQGQDYTDKEKLVMRLMMKRNSGNFFPDNNRHKLAEIPRLHVIQ